MTPEERKRKTQKEQQAGRLATWRADIKEMVPFGLLTLKEGETTVKLKAFVDKGEGTKVMACIMKEVKGNG